MTRHDKIAAQVKMLLKLSSYLKEEFNTFRGAVQFFQHKRKPELFVFQVREAHLADIGKMLMRVSFLVKMEYALLDGVSVKEKLNTPPGGYPQDCQYKNAFKHVFLNIRLDPWLQQYIFNRRPVELSPFQDVVRLPHTLQDLEQDLPKYLLYKTDTHLPLSAVR